MSPKIYNILVEKEKIDQIKEALKETLQLHDEALLMVEAKEQELDDVKHKYATLRSQFHQLQSSSISKDKEIEKLKEEKRLVIKSYLHIVNLAKKAASKEEMLRDLERDLALISW